MGDLLRPAVRGGRALRELLARGEPVLAPGAYDALGARLIEEAGFEAVYMTGFGTAAGLLGRPDVGLVTMTEMVENAGRIARACAVPVIARTDARAVEGLPSAIERARRYRDAGADVLFVEAATSEAEIETVAAELHDVPLLFNWAEGGKTPPIPYERVRELGFALVIFPLSVLLTVTASVRAALAQLRDAGSPLPILDDLPTFPAMLDFLGLPEIGQLEQRFLS